jgi:hypothetical protein
VSEAYSLCYTIRTREDFDAILTSLGSEAIEHLEVTRASAALAVDHLKEHAQVSLAPAKSPIA